MELNLFKQYIPVLHHSSRDFVGAPLLNEPSDEDVHRVDVVGDESPFKLLQTIAARRGSTPHPIKLAPDDRRFVVVVEAKDSYRLWIC